MGDIAEHSRCVDQVINGDEVEIGVEFIPEQVLTDACQKHIAEHKKGCGGKNTAAQPGFKVFGGDQDQQKTEREKPIGGAGGVVDDPQQDSFKQIAELPGNFLPGYGE